ncbi:MAG: hypothetical protein ACLQSR_17690 [Limisphaerales bacterium]
MTTHASNQIPPEFIDPRVESLPPPPPPEEDYSNRLDGVIVLVSVGDVYLAKACCASVRQSMGNIPITLLVDGAKTDTREIERLPHVKRLVAEEIVDPKIAPLYRGFWVKLLVFWAMPYERFLYLDSDTLVWGDVRQYADLDEYDFIAGGRFYGTNILETAEQVQRGVFDITILKESDPSLDWRGQDAINAGVFFARRGVFSEANLMKLRQLDCWRCYDNALLIYLYWRALREGNPRTTGRKLQLFPADSTSPPEDRFLPQYCQRPAIIHWITKKPRLGRRYRAADDYRKLFLKMTGRTKWLGARLLLEDISVWLGRQRRSLLKQRTKS